MKGSVAMLVFTGMLAGVVGMDVGAASAQVTRTEVKQDAKAGAEIAAIKWESLSPAQQQKVAAQWKMTAANAKTKWEALTPAQQNQLKGDAKAVGQAADKKWQSMPKQ